MSAISEALTRSSTVIQELNSCPRNQATARQQPLTYGRMGWVGLSLWLAATGRGYVFHVPTMEAYEARPKPTEADFRRYVPEMGSLSTSVTDL